MRKNLIHRILVVTLALPPLTCWPSVQAWVAVVPSSTTAFSRKASLCTCRTTNPEFAVRRYTGRGISTRSAAVTPPTTTTALDLSPSWLLDLRAEASVNTFMLAAETESWRQYVPLVVSCLVIIDILLGSPAANAVLGVMRPKEDDGGAGMTTSDDGSRSSVDTESVAATNSGSPFASLFQGLGGGGGDLTGGPGGPAGRNPKERVDTQAVAQEALDKAAATKELRQFLDDNKSDWDKMKEIQQKMDQELAQFDENIERQRTEFDNEIKSMEEKKNRS